MYSNTPPIRRAFAHHRPSDAVADKIESLRRQFSSLADEVVASVDFAPREQALALTKLEEAAMWAIKGLVLGDRHAITQQPIK